MRPTLDQIRYLIALAETSNFTSAARQCHISQPPFSRSIRKLEQVVGKTLVTRERGRAVLTTAGQAFLEHAQAALDFVDDAVAAAQKDSHTEDRLRVGLNEYLYVLLQPVELQDFVARHKGLVIEPVDRPQLPASMPLLERQIDMCFEVTGSSNMELWQDGIEAALIHEEPMVAMVSADSPLASQASISVSELNNRSVTVFVRDSAPQIYDDMLRAFEEQGCTIQIGHQVALLATMLATVRANDSIGLLPQTNGLEGVEGIKVLPLRGNPVPAVHLFLCWRRSETTKIIRHFVTWTRVHCRLNASAE